MEIKYTDLLILCSIIWIPATITLLPIIFHLKRESEEKLVNVACKILVFGLPVAFVLYVIRLIVLWRSL